MAVATVLTAKAGAERRMTRAFPSLHLTDRTCGPSSSASCAPTLRRTSANQSLAEHPRGGAAITAGAAQIIGCVRIVAVGELYARAVFAVLWVEHAVEPPTLKRFHRCLQLSPRGAGPPLAAASDP